VGVKVETSDCGLCLYTCLNDTRMLDLHKYAGFTQVCWIYISMLDLHKCAGFTHVCRIYISMLDLHKYAGFT
jgi:hypothetical protein